MEFVQEQGLESLILLQTWGIASLEVCGPEVPIILLLRFLLLLHNSKCTKSGQGLTCAQGVLVMQGLGECSKGILGHQWKSLHEDMDALTCGFPQ